MTGAQVASTPSVEKAASRLASLRQASLAIMIVLIVQFALGMGVNLYVALPTAGPHQSSWFGNGALLATHAVLGMILVIGAIAVLVRSIMARIMTLIVTSAAGLVAILLAAVFGSGFTSEHTNGNSLGMAMAAAVALLCYALGLFAATTRQAGH